LNYNSDGVLPVQLPQGPDYDSYKIYLFVNVIDDSYGTTVYNLPDPVYVYPNREIADNLLNEILADSPRSTIVTSLSSGNLKTVANFVTTLSTQLNIQSAMNATNDTNSTTLTAEQEKKALLREIFISKLNEMPISDLSSIKLFASALSATTTASNEISRKSAVK